MQVLFALLVTWILILAYMSYNYTRQLLNPGCPGSAEEVPGYEAVEINTNAGLTLSGWWHAPRNNRVILLLGGLGSNRDTMLADADMLVNNGYGILTIDSRPCAGEMTTLGFREIEELEAMASYAMQQPGVAWLGVLGYSIGGVTAVRGAAEMPQIKAVVSEGSFADLYKEITGIETFPLSLRWQVQQMVAGWYMYFSMALPWQVSTTSALPKIAPRPVLLVFGENEMARAQGWEQFEACGENCELWVVPDAGHGEYRSSAAGEYEARIIDFFNYSSVE